MHNPIQNRTSRCISVLLVIVLAGCAGSPKSEYALIPEGVVFTDSIPRTGWSTIELPTGDDIYFIGQSPPAASTTAAQLNIIRQGQLFLLDSLQRFYSQIRRDTVNYPVFRDLPLEDEWFDGLTKHEPFTGALATCHYKKGKIYENYSVRRQWVARGLVQWPNHVRNKLLEERLRLAIRESTSSAERQEFQSALLEISASPVILRQEVK